MCILENVKKQTTTTKKHRDQLYKMQDQLIEEDYVLFPFQEVSFIMTSLLFLQQNVVKVKKEQA